MQLTSLGEGCNATRPQRSRTTLVRNRAARVLTSVAVMLVARSEARKVATLPTSARVASCLSAVFAQLTGPLTARPPTASRTVGGRKNGWISPVT